MRGIDPTPVSRFNFNEAVKELHVSGRKLANLSKNKIPFRDLREVSQYYQSIPFLNCDILDTYMLLVTQLLKVAKSNQIDYAKKEYTKAMSLIQSKDRIEAVKHAVNAYEALYY
jgi:CRISPR/Cas system-associated protein Cas5 (RAMP superfamily)